MLQLGRAGMLEAEHLAALGIDAGHHVPDDAILAGGIHRLEDQQDGVAVRGVEQLLLLAEVGDVFGEKFVVVGFRSVDRFIALGHLSRSTLPSSRTRKSLASIFRWGLLSRLVFLGETNQPGVEVKGGGLFRRRQWLRVPGA